MDKIITRQIIRDAQSIITEEMKKKDLTGACLAVSVFAYECFKMLDIKTEIIDGYLICNGMYAVRHVWVEWEDEIIDCDWYSKDYVSTFFRSMGENAYFFYFREKPTFCEILGFDNAEEMKTSNELEEKIQELKADFSKLKLNNILKMIRKRSLQRCATLKNHISQPSYKKKAILHDKNLPEEKAMEIADKIIRNKFRKKFNSALPGEPDYSPKINVEIKTITDNFAEIGSFFRSISRIHSHPNKIDKAICKISYIMLNNMYVKARIMNIPTDF